MGTPKSARYTNKLTRQQASTIFKARTRMLPVKNNYRNKYQNHTCGACGEPVEVQKHVLEDCEVLHLVGQYKVYNKEIFSDNPNKLRTTATNIQNIMDQLNNIAENEVTNIIKNNLKPNKPVQLARKMAWAPCHQEKYTMMKGLRVFSWPISLVMIMRICAFYRIIINMKSARFQLTHFPCDDYENMCILSYHYQHEIRSKPLSREGHETMICTVCLAMFLCLMVKSRY